MYLTIVGGIVPNTLIFGHRPICCWFSYFNKRWRRRFQTEKKKVPT